MPKKVQNKLFKSNYSLHLQGQSYISLNKKETMELEDSFDQQYSKRDPSKLTAANKIREDDDESMDSTGTVMIDRRQRV